MKRGIVLLAFVFAALPTACKTNGMPNEDAGIVGEYQLVSIDEHEIPYAPMHGGQRVPTVTAGTLTLRDNGAFASKMQYAGSDGRTMNRTFTGTYKTDGANYILRWHGAGTTLVTIDDGTLTMNNEGMLFVYEK